MSKAAPGLCLFLRLPAEQTAQPVAGLDEDHGDRIRNEKDTAMADGRIRLSHAGRDGQPAGRPVEYLRRAAALPGPDSRWPAWNAGSRSCSAGITDTEDRRTVTAYAAWRYCTGRDTAPGMRPVRGVPVCRRLRK